MASRRNVPPARDEYIVPFHGITHRNSLPGLSRPVEPLPLPLLEDKLASQAVEIEQFSGDNHKLACSHISLRQDLVAAHREVEKLREHIRSIQTEGDIQIRVLLDKIGKMEEDIRSGENIKKELQEARLEAQILVKSRLDLTDQIQHATQELDNVRADAKKLPEMRSELKNLNQEHQRLRKIFEYEKGLNVEKVEQMKIIENDVIRKVEEVERLRAEVLNAEKRASAPSPYVITCINSEYTYPPPFHGNGGYTGSYGRPLPHMVGVEGQGTNTVPGSGFAVFPPTVGDSVVSGSGFPTWGVAYDASYIQR